MPPPTRALPTARLGRLVRLARLGAKTGVSALFSKDGASAAEDAAEVLGTMRGLAAKIGQMASYVDGMVPESHRESYEKALRALRDAAPRSSPAKIRAVVEDELGAPIGELFATWSDEPFASASIGQVHAATLADGREVAVKVQHPGIERAIESDLSNASMFEGAIRMLGPRALQTKATFEVIRERFREELDYRLEAERQGHFGKLHAGDPTIRIPAVIADRSARRVITSELVRGATIDEVATRSADERRACAETLWRFVFKGNLVGGMFNADPHPGNYVFHEGGVISFLDFGCVQPIAPEQQSWARKAHFAALAKDEEAYRVAMRGMLGLVGGKYEEFALPFVRNMFAPLFSSPWHMTREYVAGIVGALRDTKLELVSKGAKFVAPPPSMVFMNRLQFGFYSVLAHLDVEADYAEVERAFLRDAGLLPGG